MSEIIKEVIKTGKIVTGSGEILDKTALYRAAGSQAGPVGTASVNTTQFPAERVNIVGSDNMLYNEADMLKSIGEGIGGVSDDLSGLEKCLNAKENLIFVTSDETGIRLSQTAADSFVIDWGDGTSTQSGSSTVHHDYQHIYIDNVEYHTIKIKLNKAEGVKLWGPLPLYKDGWKYVVVYDIPKITATSMDKFPLLIVTADEPPVYDDLLMGETFADKIFVRPDTYYLYTTAREWESVAEDIEVIPNLAELAVELQSIDDAKLSKTGGQVTGAVTTTKTTFTDDQELVSKKYVDDNAGSGTTVYEIGTPDYDNRIQFTQADLPYTVPCDGYLYIGGWQSRVSLRYKDADNNYVGIAFASTSGEIAEYGMYPVTKGMVLEYNAIDGAEATMYIVPVTYSGGAGGTIDTTMSDTSTNPVQNKVIKDYIDKAIAAITDYESEVFPQNG